jgi:hypothetical protein
MSSYNSDNFKKLIDLCSDVKSTYKDIDALYNNILCTHEDPEFISTIITCYSQLSNRYDFSLSHLSGSEDAIEILIKNDRYDIIHLHAIKYGQMDLLVAANVAKYSFEHSKISTLKLLINDLIECTQTSGGLTKRILLSYIKEKILFYYGFYGQSYSDITELVMDWYPIYQEPKYFSYLLQGACTGNQLEFVKDIMSDPNFVERSNIIKSCVSYTLSVDIVKLLHDHEPDIAVSIDFFRNMLVIKKRLDIIDWMVDNNIKVSDFGNDYIYIVLVIQSYSKLSVDAFLYFIVNRKLPVLESHLRKAMYWNNDFNFLLLLHYYIPVENIIIKESIYADTMDMYLSLYLSTYDKDKMKDISINYQDISANTYMDRYTVTRREFHEELQLLFDLPIDLCKQIL